MFNIDIKIILWIYLFDEIVYYTIIISKIKIDIDIDINTSSY